MIKMTKVDKPTDRRFIDLEGNVFHRLTVLKYAGKQNKSSCWLCMCECGESTVACTSDLRRGFKKSCGCWRSENTAGLSYIHGLSKTDEFHIWQGIKKRCLNKKCIAYADYGGRGIVICEEWKDDFISFLNHVGKRPSKMHSIDRIDNEGNYEPGNVRWATDREQASNTRSSKMVTYRGQTLPLIQWVEKLGVSYGRVLSRMQTGWSVSDAFEVGIGERKKVIEFGGESLTPNEWEKRTGILAGTINERIRRGWSVSDALTKVPMNTGKARQGNYCQSKPIHPAATT